MGQDLLGERPEKPPKKRKAEPQSDGLVKEGIDLYFALHIEKYGCKPTQGGRLAKTMREFGDAWGREELLRVIREFFSTRDYKIDSSDRSVSVWALNAERLKKRTAAPAGQLSAAERRIAGNIEAAARASGHK